VALRGAARGTLDVIGLTGAVASRG
jgi:hypothetical protein